jgi:hypothetical protein
MIAKSSCCVLVLLCLACAAKSDSTPRSDIQQERIDVSGAIVRLDVDRSYSNNRIPVSRERSWGVIAEVFDSLKIPMEFADHSAFRAGNQKFIMPRQVGGQPKSAYLRCGNGPSGPLADSHRVTMSLITELRALSSDSTGVYTQIIASARPTEGTSGEPVVCASSGALEKTVADLVRRRGEAIRR